MSAFLCTPHHIAALAWEFHKQGVYGDTVGHSLEGWARDLAFSNYSAIVERYDAESALKMAGGQTRPEYMSACAKEARETRPQYSLIQLLKALDCYEYQACEYSRYRDRTAPCLNDGHVSSLRKYLVQELQGYDSADWSLAS